MVWRDSRRKDHLCIAGASEGVRVFYFKRDQKPLFCLTRLIGHIRHNRRLRLEPLVAMEGYYVQVEAFAVWSQTDHSGHETHSVPDASFGADCERNPPSSVH